MTAIRLRPAGVQAARDTYTNGKRTITLQGVVHIADPSFYSAVSDHLAEAEANGAAIHYEAVRNDMDNPPNLGLDYERLAKLTRLQPQKVGLSVRDTWRNHDMTLSQLMATADPDKLAKHEAKAERMAEMLDDLETSDMRHAMGRMLRAMLKVLPLMPTRIQPGIAGVSRTVMIDNRNTIAAKAALEAEGDVVAIWGAAHLPGIGKQLRQAGFTRTNREWLTAIGPRVAKYRMEES